MGRREAWRKGNGLQIHSTGREYRQRTYANEEQEKSGSSRLTDKQLPRLQRLPDLHHQDTMKISTIVVSILYLSAWSPFMGYSQQSPPARVDAAPELSSPGHPPTGILGKQLGIRITITGESPTPGALLPNPIAAKTVDGKALPQPIPIEVRDIYHVMKPKVGMLTIYPGTHYELEGYESGGFEGAPQWVMPMVQQPFQYRHFFVVTKVLQPTNAP